MTSVTQYLATRAQAPAVAPIHEAALAALARLRQAAQDADALAAHADAHQAAAADRAAFGALAEVTQLSNRLSQELWGAYERVRTSCEVTLHLTEAEGRLQPPADGGS
jgi:uncharacterized protein (DUF2345 family)